MDIASTDSEQTSVGLAVDVSGTVLTVTIDAPPVNAFTMARYEELTRLITDASARDDIHCIILTATGTRAFCAGLDLHEFLNTPVSQDDRRQEIGVRCFRAITDCPVPIIAAVNGAALGAGAVFASLCDIRIASELATFGLPEINVGRCGGAAYVARHVSPGVVRQMFFTGKALSATEALRVGLVQEVVPAGELTTSALALAEAIAAKSPLGLRLGKKALNESEFLPADEGYAVEQRYSAQLVLTEDSREALRSVVEKRAPVFHGR
jgi:enoyl-CoA hydratase